MSEEKIQVVERRDIGLLITALVVLALSVALSAVSTVLIVRDAEQLKAGVVLAQQTHRGVCLFRQNLADQVRSSEHYLLLHPEGAPTIGLGRKQIENGIDKQKAAVTALADIPCQEVRIR